MSAIASSYRSKVNPFLGTIVAAAFLASLVTLVEDLRRASTASDALFSVLFLLLLFIVLGPLVPMRYVIGPQELTVQSGFLKQRIPLASIRRIYPSHSLLASPAWSLDRIAIEYGSGRLARSTVYISPVQQQRFAEELATAARLVRSGTEWVRAEQSVHQE